LIFYEAFKSIISELIVFIVWFLIVILLSRLLVLLDRFIEAVIFGGLQKQSNDPDQSNPIELLCLNEILDAFDFARGPQNFINVIWRLEGDHFDDHDGNRVKLHLKGINLHAVVLCQTLQVNFVVALVSLDRVQACLTPNPIFIIHRFDLQEHIGGLQVLGKDLGLLEPGDAFEDTDCKISEEERTEDLSFLLVDPNETLQAEGLNFGAEMEAIIAKIIELWLGVVEGASEGLPEYGLLTTLELGRIAEERDEFDNEPPARFSPALDEINRTFVVEVLNEGHRLDIYLLIHIFLGVHVLIIINTAIAKFEFAALPSKL
jgi:hypothetical protein